MSELKYNPLTETWNIIPSAQHTNTQQGNTACPFCTEKEKGSSSYDSSSKNQENLIQSGPNFYTAKKASASAEVILYSSSHTTALHELSVQNIRKIVDVWVQRMKDHTANKANRYVMVLENKNESINGNITHPHSHIYASSWIPVNVQTELDASRNHFKSNHECLLCGINKEEQSSRKGMIFENASFSAYLPFFAEDSCGIFITSNAHKNYLTDFNDQEQNDLAEILKIVTGTLAQLFSSPVPYQMCMYQNPIHSSEYSEAKDFYHFHIEFSTPGMPRITPEQLHKAKLAFLASYNEKLLRRDFVADFVSLYGESDSDVHVIASPARINLIGEHIDYNGGQVFPAAIDKYLYIAIRKRHDSKVVYNALSFPGEHRFDIKDSFAYGKNDDYANYLNGILKSVIDSGAQVNVGFDVLIFSIVPAGGGVSSSAALEVGFGYALSALFNLGLDRIDIAKMGQMAEHTFMNVKCGIMDQFAVAMGKKGHAILLDTNTLEYRYAPLELGDYRIIVMNTNKKRALADSKYNERHAQCMEGLALLQKSKKIGALCELLPAEFDSLASTIADEIIRKRVKHCVYENERVKQSVRCLENKDLSGFGRLMHQSHISLRDDYEVTGLELDSLFNHAFQFVGCIGTRMTGAGFGGCAIALVHKDRLNEFTNQIGSAYTKDTGLEATFTICETGDGVRNLDI